MGLARISWMQIEEYCDKVRLYGPERDIMHHHIQAMDKEYLEAVKRKNKPTPPPPPTKSK